MVLGTSGFSEASNTLPVVGDGCDHDRLGGPSLGLGLGVMRGFCELGGELVEIEILEEHRGS